MKLRIKMKKIGMVMLTGLLLLQTPFTAYATSVGTTAVKTANFFMMDLDDAQDALEEIVDENPVSALIYLTDAYTLKKEADAYSEDVATIMSGQEVKIVGVDADSGKNIWYEVEYDYEGGFVEGYIEREFLVFVDERMLAFEEKNITSRRRASVHATTTEDIEQFPDSYKDYMYDLKRLHPEWIFVRMDTGLDWNWVVKEQSVGERNLVRKTSAWNEEYYDEDSTKEPGYACASDALIKFYLDPRTSLEEDRVFQFEMLTYNPSYHTKDAVQKILNGTFMSGMIPGEDKTYAAAFMDIAQSQNVSPLFLASRVRQEQGASGSALVKGNYPGYEGLYNYYNIGATGSGTTNIIINGLKKAQDKGWTTHLKSLSGGASFLTKEYISVGQDTGYLQKFDVDDRYKGVCSHQYMQNILAPTSESQQTYKGYKEQGMLDNRFVFKVPVYNNMPKYTCIRPGTEDKLTLNSSEVENLPVGQKAVLTAYINGAHDASIEMSYVSSNEKVATVDNNGVVTGVAPGTTTITCKRKENSSAATTATCVVAVIKADISISKVDIPEIEVTYSPSQTLGDIDLPDNFAWVDEDTVPIVDNNGYSVTYNPDNSKYNTLTLTIPVVVEKAVVDKDDIDVPKDLSISAGAELSSVALPSGFAWAEPNTVLPKRVGTYSYEAYYCLDVANYEITEDIMIEVNTSCTEHEFSEWTGDVADCEHDGKMTRTCTICDKEETVETERFGHLYKDEVTKEPTEKEVGIRTYTCERCHDSYEEEIPKVIPSHKHKYESTISTEPTCTETGEKTFTCDCGDSYTEVVDALGHDLHDGICSRCGYEAPKLPVHKHAYTLASCTATCTEAGKNVYVCDCGESYEEDADALGHDLEDDSCTRCDYTKHKHNYEFKETTATCKQAGKNIYECECGDTNEKDVDALGHNIVNGSCTRCDYKELVGGDSTTTKPETGGDSTTTKPEAGGDSTTTKPEAGGDSTTTKPETGGDSTETKPETGGDSTETKPDSSGNTSSKPSTDSNSKQESKPDNNDKKKEDKKPTGILNTLAEAIVNIANPLQGVTTTAPIQDVEPQQNETQKNESKQNLIEAESMLADNKSKTDTEVTEEDVERVKIVMKHSTILDENKLKGMAKDEKKLELVMAEDVVWKVDLSEVDDIAKVSVNMAVTLNHAEIPEEIVQELSGDDPVMLMSLSHEGPFEFKATLSVPIEKQYVGKYANLFYYNEETKNMEFIASCLVSEEGYADFDMAHASDYAIVMTEEDMDPEVVAQATEEAEKKSESVVMVTTEEKVDTVKVLLVIAIVVLIAILTVAFVVLIIKWTQQREEDAYYLDSEDEEDKIE